MSDTFITVSREQLRIEMSHFLNKVQYQGQSVVITKYGKPVACLVPATKGPQNAPEPTPAPRLLTKPHTRTRNFTKISEDGTQSLRKMAKNARISQTAIASELGVTIQAVNNWFGGRAKPRAYQSQELSRLLGVPRRMVDEALGLAVTQ
jgi:prevent-host-death family protein